LKAISGAELARLLEKQGWILLRIHGSHHIYGKAGRKERLSIPMHGNKQLKIGLLKRLLDLASLSTDILS
jgi:predicted RNA binding protein YcfA (HicA-like mRNA interferase family)